MIGLYKTESTFLCEEVYAHNDDLNAGSQNGSDCRTCHAHTQRKYKEPITKDINTAADDDRCHSKPRCTVVADKGTDKGRKNEHWEKPDQPAGIFHYLGHQLRVSTKESENLLMKQCKNDPH